jgi:hypothetical protein
MKYALLLALLAAAPITWAQTAPTAKPAAVSGVAPKAARYTTATGQVTFFSSTPIEDIEALNQQVAAIFDLNAGKLAFSLLMRGFVFKSTLMQDHFNENYAESEKYPRARFSGLITKMPSDELLRSGPQPVEVQGHLTIHGVKRKIKVPGTLFLRGDELVATSKFAVAPADYKIKIPALVRDNIAKSIDVSIILSCRPASLSASLK